MSRKTGETWGTPITPIYRTPLSHYRLFFMDYFMIRSCRGRANRHYQNVGIVDPDWTRLSEKIITKTAPGPLLGRSHQAPRHGIPVDVSQLLDSLRVGPNVEIVKARLPETVRTG